MKCKEPNAAATRKQTWALYCIYKKDYRDAGLTRQEASDLISKANGNGKKNSSKKKATVKKNPGNRSAASKWAFDLIKKAEAAGEKAVKECTPTPMIVAQHANVLDDNSPITKQWVAPGGVCGFASIRVKCVNGPSRKFINQLKKVGIAGGDRYSGYDTEWYKSDYYGGYMKAFTMIGGQSMELKTAYAYGYAGVLDKAGIDTWVWTKED